LSREEALPQEIVNKTIAPMALRMQQQRTQDVQVISLFLISSSPSFLSISFSFLHPNPRGSGELGGERGKI